MQSNILKTYFDKNDKWHLKKKKNHIFAKFVHVLRKRQHFAKTRRMFIDGTLKKPALPTGLTRDLWLINMTLSSPAEVLSLYIFNFSF